MSQKLICAFVLFCSMLCCEFATAAKANFEIYGGVGLPSLTSYGATLYLGETKEVGVRFQAGSGRMAGDVGYDNLYEEVLFFVNRSKSEDNWQKFVGVGIGRQEISVQTDFKDNVGTFYREKEHFDKTYLKLNISIMTFQSNGFTFGSDIGMTYPLRLTSSYFANAEVQASDNSPYSATQRSFTLLKSILATGLSFQINIFRVGWSF